MTKFLTYLSFNDLFPTHKLVVSRNLLSTSIALSCFNLLIFYFKKFSTWLPLAVHVKLNLGYLITFLHHDKLLWNTENNSVLALQEKSPLGLKKTKQSPKQQEKLFVVLWSANCNHVTVKILIPAEWTLTASRFVFNIMFLWPCYLCHRMNNKTVVILSSLTWWVF